MNALPLWKLSSDLGKRVAPLLDLRRGATAAPVYARGPVTLWGFGLVWRDETGTLCLPRIPYAPGSFQTSCPWTASGAGAIFPPRPRPRSPRKKPGSARS